MDAAEVQPQIDLKLVPCQQSNLRKETGICAEKIDYHGNIPW